ncbi:MAG: DUF5615 family PIN-like protein [Planctomycetaceae bacterium]
MKFLVDAQLPRRLAAWLFGAGHDAKHTLDLPDGNRSSDSAIVDCADREQRVVVTKDADFVNSHVLHGKPEKLVLISTGNITNSELEQLLTPLIPDIASELTTSRFVEVGRTGMVVRQ